MSYSRSFKQLSRAKKLGVLLIGSVLAWALGLPAFINTASAASLTTVSDTIVSSATSTATNHVIVWTGSNAVAAGQTIRVQFTPGNAGTSDEFTLPSFATSTDLTITGSVAITEVANAAACSGAANEVYNSLNNNIAGDRFIELTVCPTDTIAAQTITLSFINNHVVNPATTGSYIIRITSGGDTADTRVAIIQTVTMSAIVDTSLTFTIAGLPANTVLAGTLQSSTSTSATNISFGRLQVASSTLIGAQQLTVSTNAQNGYQVTVVANQALTSNTGADIDFFIDGAHTAAPTAWQAPANTLGNENTYGHFGLSTDDASLNGGDLFSGGTLYVGNFASVDGPRQVMYHNGPVNGVTTGVGTTNVWYRVQIANLQEAGADYSNVLTYVCTPVF